jgi:hypothetical protein
MDEFDNPFIKKWLDATPADAIRALRPGGPLDSVFLKTRCLKCGAQVNQAIRWFQACDFSCACGGKFNEKPLRRAVSQMIVNYQIATKPPDELIQFLEDAQRDNKDV